MKVLKSGKWSKSEAFLLPLTGLQKEGKYKIESYLYWDNYSIDNYNLIIKMRYTNYNDFIAYCKRHIFPVLNKNAYMVESHDVEGGCIFILDIADWKPDVDWFLLGKYSKMSSTAKDLIAKYHAYYDKNDVAKLNPIKEIYIVSALEPNIKLEELGNVTPIRAIANEYRLNYADLKKIGEAAGIFDAEGETLKDIVAEKNE